MNISKNKIKFIHSLEQKKNRRQENAFIAEGHKTVGDLLLEGFEPLLIVHTEEWKSPIILPSSTEIIQTSEEYLIKTSLLVHPQQVIGVFKIPQETQCSIELIAEKDLVLCLDGIQDPGNLGTIIRTADWFGIRHLFCSQQTVDAFSPKVVQATMGSIARVNIHYTDIAALLKGLKHNTPIYGTLLNGDDIYQQKLDNRGVIIIGNEGKGISEEIQQLITHRLTIPTFNTSNKTAESLNVSIATAIVLSEFRRQSVKLS